MRKLWPICFVLCLLTANHALAQSELLDSLKGTVSTRQAFQKRFPLATKLFSNQSGPEDRKLLTEKLTETDASESGMDSAQAVLWGEFAFGMALSKETPGAGDEALKAALQSAAGSLPVNFEMARILADNEIHPWAATFQKAVHGEMLLRGYTRLPEFAKMELARANAALKADKPGVAEQAVGFAEKLDPVCPWTPLFDLKVALRGKPIWNWNLDLCWSAAQEIFHRLRYYDAQALLLVNLSRILRAGLGLFAGLCLLVLLAKYFTRISHPWAEKLPSQVEMRVRYLVLALIPMVLWLAGAGFLILMILGILLLWKHCSPRERFFLKTVLTGLAVLPVVLSWETSKLKFLDRNAGMHFYRLAYGRGYEKNLSEELANYQPRSSEDGLYKALASSLMAKKQGDFPLAGREGGEALRLASQNPIALVNAGNVSLLDSDYSKAMNYYSQAQTSAPYMAEAWFNAGQTALFSGKPTQQMAFLNKAADLDPQRITLFLKDNDENFTETPYTRKVMDPMLRPESAWISACEALLNFDLSHAPVIRTGFLKFPAIGLTLGAVLAALGLFFRFRNYSERVHGKDLFECKICGRILCRVCRKGVHCQKCFKTVAAMPNGKIRMELALRLKKQSNAFPSGAGRVLNLAIPGTGDLYLGNREGKFGWPLWISLALGSLYGGAHLLMEYPVFVLGALAWAPSIFLVFLYLMFHLLRRIRKSRTWSPGQITAMPRLKEDV